MNKPIVSIIVAIDKNNVIGDSKTNKMLWYIPEELKRFKQITTGHPIIMGRKTFESIGKVLPNRTNIIITSDINYHVENAVVAHSLEDAMAEGKKIDQEEIFIIGGGQIFRLALPFTDRIYLTTIEGEFQGDVQFPDYSEFKTILSQSSQESNGHKYTYYTLTK